MAFDAFLKIDKIDGESTEKGFEKWMEIQSFSLGGSNPTTVGPGSQGLSGGRVSISDLTFFKNTDKGSCKLFMHCCTGEHFGEVTLSLKKATGEGGQDVFLMYKLEDVMVSSIQWSGSSGGSITPGESVSLTFAKVTIEYKTQDPKSGKLATAGQASWDVTKTAS